jgi:hypothetical protein
MLGLAGAYQIDILDSAQEAFPYMWVNGEKYVFSEHVIEKGTNLFVKFQDITHMIISMENTKQSLESLTDNLKLFDRLWCVYEQAYIGELIVIERDSRRYLSTLIESVQDEKKFIEAIGQINVVANPEGKGRQDFSAELLDVVRQLNIRQVAVQALSSRVTRAYA